MAVGGKVCGDKTPYGFPSDLGNRNHRFPHSSAQATTANLTQIQNPKGPSPLRLTFVPFSLILRLEKTPRKGDRKISKGTIKL